MDIDNVFFELFKKKKGKILMDIDNVYFEFFKNKRENKIRHCQCLF